MAADHSEMGTATFDPSKKPSNLASVEQDSDSVCDSMLEYCSDAGSEVESPLNSVSHNFATMQARHDSEESEIEKLIHAAETLALERGKQITATETIGLETAKLKKQSGSIPEMHKLNQNAAPMVGGRASNAANKILESEQDSLYEISDKGASKVEVPLESDFRAAESRYSVQNDVKQISMMFPNNHIQTKDNLSCFDESEKKSHDSDESGLSLTNSGNDSVLAKTSSTKANTCVNSEAAFLNTIPSLSLEHTNDAQEERIIVTKDVKDVCNSSIKESSTDRPETQMTEPSKNSRGRDDSTHSRPQTGGDSLSNGSHDLKEVSVAVHNESSSLLSLALTSTSSLGYVIRLLRQVTALQFGMDTPRVSAKVMQELMEYEAQHRNLEFQLNNAATELQMAVAQVQGVENLLEEQHQEAIHIEKNASQLLGQVEAGLDSNGLQHMVAITSPRRRNTARMLEGIASALTLLIGELNRKTLQTCNLEEELRHHSQEIQTLREILVDKDSRLRSGDHEVLKLREKISAETTSLRQCLAQAEQNLSETEQEKVKLGETLKKQAVENSIAMVQLQHKLSDFQRETDSRVRHLEYKLQDSATEKETLESTAAELKNQLILRTQQINLVDEENNLLVEGLRSTLKHQQAEVDQSRLQLDTALTNKNNLTRRVNELESELSVEQMQQQELIKELSDLKTSINSLKMEHTETEKSLQGKIDSSNLTRCELEGRVRSLDLTILQLRTELRMEQHKSTALSDETNYLHKKVKDLQDRIWCQARRRRNNSTDSVRSSDSRYSIGGSSACGKNSSVEYGSCVSLLSTTVGNFQADQHVQCIVKDVEDGQAREEHLHTLLRQKDEALHSLQHSVTTQINTKNEELEELNGKVSILEDQLGSLLSALEVSAAVGNITTEVGSLLQERTEYLNSLDQSSHLLQDELSSLALENQTLSSELSLAKKNERDAAVEARESARIARQEARDERVAAAHIKEKCLQLQSKLDSVQSTLEQERQERRINEVVNAFKHQEFGSLLDSATAFPETRYSGQ